MSSELIWNNNDTNTEKLRKVYNAANNLLYEMEDGKVEVIKTPLSIAFVKMAEKGEIDEVTASEHAEMFLYWSENGTYNIGDLRRYGEDEAKLYKCLQAHTSQANWTPDVSPSLWKACGISENGIPEWSQPISTSDAYMIGDEVMYEGVHYRSIIDNNVWSPTDYPQCWQIVE